MTNALPLMVFTDLDGTLIDHKTYGWDAARPAVSALKGIGAGIVLASSKTSVEVAALRRAMGFEAWPAIIENGAGILPPRSDTCVIRSGYAALRAAIDKTPEALRACFRGFGDLTTEEVAKLTGLAAADAARAKQRAFSEPGQWLGTAEQRKEFLSCLNPQGIIGQQGGRFLTLSFGGNKVDQMRQIIQTYRPQHTIALGDAPNDIAMLEAADFGVVVTNPEGHPLDPLRGEDTGRIIRTRDAGPSGWNTAVLDLLTRLDLT